VVDASPLIHLSRTRNIHLLTTLGPTILVPAPVYLEVLAKTSDEAAQIVQDTPWLSRVPVPDVPAEIGRWDLGAGESAVLTWAQAHPGSVAILDDARARRLSQDLRIPVIGTLGIVVRAKRYGLIPSARPIVESLIAQGMYLSPLVLRDALAVVGE
jgi:predicted nucleic acid-binding protein